MNLRLLLLVCLGGAVGSGLRYSVAVGMARLAGTGFPYGTLAVNVVGSFLLTALIFAWPETSGPRVEWKLVLGTGVLGGFTTYSAFNTETLSFLQTGETLKAAGYLTVTLVGCLVAGALGMWVGRLAA